MRCMGLFNHINKNWRVLLGFLVVFVSFPTILLAKSANTAVIANGTRATHLIQNYLKMHPIEIDAIEQTQDDTIQALDQIQQLSQQTLAEEVAASVPKVVRLPSIYPIRSQLLSPGKVVTRYIQAALPQPVFIVGDDALSKHWLRRYQMRLSMLNAKGFVVNVNSRSAIHTLQAQFPHLLLIPMDGDQFAQWLKLKHYPVLISSGLIEQ